MNYRFQNLLGAPYRGGDAVFAADSPVLLSAVGNRVASTDLAAASSPKPHHPRPQSKRATAALSSAAEAQAVVFSHR
jgi:hypothetical protein